MNKNEGQNPAPPPCPCEAGKMSRRTFFERLSIFLGGAGASLLAVPMIGFILGPVFKRRPSVWRSIGKIGDFKIGETVAVKFEDSSPLPWSGVTAHTAAWLRRETAADFIAFSVNCSHLGCPVRWLPQANLFMCPCHGGVYYRDGSVAAGPPPRPLWRFEVRTLDGTVQIQTNPIRMAKG
jgi:quinol---cytochrome c reductase iron-sulfur subunit, bacillus type